MIIPKKLSYSVTMFIMLFCTLFYSSAEQKTSQTKELIGLYLLNKKLDQNDFDQFLQRNQMTTNDVVVLLNERKFVLQKEIIGFKETQSPIFYWLGGIAGSIAGWVGNKGYEEEQEKISQSWHQIADYEIVSDTAMRELKEKLNKGIISQAEYDVRVKEWYKLIGSKPTLYESPLTSAYQLLIAGGLIMVPFAAYKGYRYYMYERDRRKEIEIIDNILEQINALKQDEQQ